MMSRGSPSSFFSSQFIQKQISMEHLSKTMAGFGDTNMKKSLLSRILYFDGVADIVTDEGIKE